ncbi:MAG: hypothetical protein EXR69_00855 [Myxococcales bacterium]|nr:hypothetical protein [Myxococcales bacterium]
MLLVTMLALPAYAADACPSATVASGRDPVDAAQAEVLGWLNTGDAAALHARFSGDFQAAVPLPAIQGLVDGIAAQSGCFRASKRVSGSKSAAEYEISSATHRWLLNLQVDDAGQIGGLKIAPPPPADPPVARSSLPLRFPVDGAWTVVWGGDTAALNHHISLPSQRRAADLVITDATGKTHAGDGSKFTDYYAYGKPIYAVAAGTVVTQIDGVPETPLGQLSPSLPLGNSVILDHGGTYSLVAHLQSGSVKVKLGQKVKAGQELGRCGSTGNSTEPHLHFQLMDGHSVDRSFGIEAMFSDVTGTRGGTALPPGEYTFLKGDVVTGAGSR